MSDSGMIGYAEYLGRVLNTHTVYGCPGDVPLSSAEEALVRHAHDTGLHHREAVRAVLSARGQWPCDPNPLRRYPKTGIPTSYYARSDDYGRT